MKKEILRVLYDRKFDIKEYIEFLKKEKDTENLEFAKYELKEINECIKWIKSIKV